MEDAVVVVVVGGGGRTEGNVRAAVIGSVADSGGTMIEGGMEDEEAEAR